MRKNINELSPLEKDMLEFIITISPEIKSGIVKKFCSRYINIYNRIEKRKKNCTIIYYNKRLNSTVESSNYDYNFIFKELRKRKIGKLYEKLQ